MLREFHSLSRQSPNFRTSAAAWLVARVNKKVRRKIRLPANPPETIEQINLLNLRVRPKAKIRMNCSIICLPLPCPAFYGQGF